MNIEGPEVLSMPDKLLPILEKFNDYRYFLIEGGRGGGKTQGVSRIISYISEKRGVRVFCGRETQNTIHESVHTVFKDVIGKYNLNFSVFNDKIVHNTTGSEIRFKGFREQGSVNIKGMEGVDIVWIDEAQAITQNTLDTLIPTIRKQKAKIFFTMNRHLKSDAVYKMFGNHPNCLHININYTDNPFISKALHEEALICKRERPEDYRHIWGGEPLADADNYLFNDEALEACLTRTFPHDSHLYHGRVLGSDVARFGDNYSAGLILKQCGPMHWEEEFLDRWKKHDAVYSTGKFNEMIVNYNPDYTIIDADGLGGPVYDFVAKGRKNILPFHGGQVKDDVNWKAKYKNWRTYGYLKLNDMVNAGHLRLKSRFIVDQLKEIKFRYDVTMRKYIIPKEQLIEEARKKGVKYNSPDEADALMMAVTQVGTIQKEQAEMYTRQHGRNRSHGGQTYAAESNLI